MTAADFTRRWIGLIALLAGLIVASPYLIDVLVDTSGCRGTSGACGALAAVFSIYGRVLVLAIVLIPLMLAVAGRTLAVGVFAWAFPFALLMLAGALPILFSLANFWAASFALGIIGAPGLLPLLYLLVLLIALSAYGDDERGGAAVTAWRTVLGAIAVAAVFVTAPEWLAGLGVLPWIGHLALPASLALARAHAAFGITGELPQLANGLLIAFTVAAAGLVIAGRSRPAPARTRRVSRA